MPKRVEINILSKKQFYTLNELKDLGISNYIANKMVKKGKFEKINGNTYENLEYVGEKLDFYYVSAYAPNGVICLMSAARYYNLTTY